MLNPRKVYFIDVSEVPPKELDIFLEKEYLKIKERTEIDDRFNIFERLWAGVSKWN